MPFTRLCSVTGLFVAILAVSGGLRGQSPAPDVVTVLKGHIDTVDVVALSPDGTIIATGSFDKTIKLWDAATGKEIRTYGGQQGHQGQVLAVAFSARGDQIASGSTDNSARIWDVPVGTPGKVFAHSGAATRVAVAADGKTFAVAGGDGVIKLFPLGEEKGALDLKGHVGAVTGIGFTANNQFLISAGADRTVRFWSPTDGKAIATYGSATADITGLAVNPNNAAAYTTSADGVLRFWQVPPPAQPKAPPPAKDAITSLYVTPDGATALYASADKTATLVPVATGIPGGTFAGAKGAIETISLSPDQQTVAAGCANGSLILWDRQGKVKAEVPANPGGVTAIGFHPSQPVLLAAGADGIAKGWNLPIDPKQPKEKAAKFEIKAHTGKVTAAAIHPTNGQIVTAGADKLVRIWDPAQPMKALREIGPLAAPVTTLTISRDGQTIAGAVGKDVILWNPADGKEMGKVTQPADVLSLSFNADKTRLLLGRADNLAVLVEVATGVVVQSFGHGGAVRGVFHNTTQPQVVTASADKTILVHPVTAVRAVVVGTGKPAGVVVSPAGERVLSVGPGKEVVSWNTGNGVKEKAFETGGEAGAAALSKDGQRVAVGGADGSVKLYTVGDGKMISSFVAGAPVVDLAFHPTNPVLVGALNTKTVVAWNVAFVAGQPVPPEFGRPIQTYPHPAAVSGLAFNAEGLFFSAAEDKQARRFRIAADIPVKNFQHPNLVDAVAFDETGTLLATGCHDGILRIWDIAKATPLKTINAHVQTMPMNVQHPIYSVAWAPGSKQVLTASYDKSVKLWDVAAGTLVKEFKAAPDPAPGAKVEPPKEPVGHRDQVFAAVFTKDGKYFATGSSDRTAKLWDVAAGKVVRDFANPDLKSVQPGEPAPSHPGWVHTVRFTPDDKLLVTIGPAPRYRGYLAVWSVADGKRLAGTEFDLGALHGLAITPDGTKLILGCGPKSRTAPEADAVILKMPGR
ncbi:MAG: domain, G-beta repeat [Gemmataceae bacterium]|nr:domain, G-beta repeat [Gemmataceae bacterium]